MDISYQWIRSHRKTIAIQIDRNGQVILRTPYWITKRQAEKFLDEKKEWILKNIRRVENRKTDEILISEEQRREGIERAKRIFPERTAYFALRMGVDYGRITIREQKTRWGSCSSKGNLNFNWKLILVAPDILDYVVVHVLAHSREMNHSTVEAGRFRNVSGNRQSSPAMAHGVFWVSGRHRKPKKHGKITKK